MFFLPAKYAGQMLSEVSDIIVPETIYIVNKVQRVKGLTIVLTFKLLNTFKTLTIVTCTVRFLQHR